MSNLKKISFTKKINGKTNQVSLHCGLKSLVTTIVYIWTARHMLQKKTHKLDMYSGGSRGAAARAPYGSRFFRFDIQIFQNVAASGVGSPPRGQRPPTGNPGSATDVDLNLQGLSHTKNSTCCNHSW